MHLAVKLSENNFYHHKNLRKFDFISFNLVVFVRKMPAAISSLYHKVIKYISKSTLLKVDITQKEPIT